MNNLKKILVVGLVSGGVNAATVHNMDYYNKHHAQMMEASESNITLTEAGTDPFAVIQEAIKGLEAGADTNWTKVDFEGLRKHLVEMNDMTLNVDVQETDIEDGFKAIVIPTHNRAIRSLSNVLKNHPVMMEAETGWKMKVERVNDLFVIKVTTKKLEEVDKIRGLGYIGVMAYGNHHQPHHKGMVLGNNPHK